MIDLLFKDSPTKIDVLTLHATISEGHDMSSEPTAYPVEHGADITDHVRDKPDRITIEGIISNTPLSHGQALEMVETQAGIIERVRLLGSGGYAETAFRTLKELKRTKKLITVQTAYETYSDMILVGLNVPRTASTGDALEFTATFQQIRFVQNRTTTRIVAAEPKAHKKTKLGPESPKVTPAGTAGEASELQSSAHSIKDAVSRKGVLGGLGEVGGF